MPACPCGEPISLYIAVGSWYSLMSSLIISFSDPKYASASAFAVSVFPTPVGPKNKKLPNGRFVAESPVLARLKASETALIAVS